MNAPASVASEEPSPPSRGAAGMGPLQPPGLDGAQSSENPALGCIGGAAAAIAGAIVWAAIAVVTNRLISWAAIGVGFLVGGAVRLLGRGTGRAYGAIGAVLSLLGCLAGNLLTVAIVVSREEAVPLANVLAHFVASPGAVVQALTLTFELADLLFYGMAAYAGYWFSSGGAAKAKVAPTQVESLPRPIAGPGHPAPSLRAMIRKDVPSNSLFLPIVSLWLCWLLASIGILPGRAGLRSDAWANLATIQRWFLIGALAVSAVCVPLLARRMLVIRSIFRHAAEVDGQVIRIPRRPGWTTLIIEYYYTAAKHRIGYTVPDSTHPDQRLQVGDNLRLLVNNRNPKHAIVLSMFN